MSIQVDGQKMRDLAQGLKKELPGWGFALFVFKFDDGGGMTNYISNAMREDMISAIEEQLASLKRGRDIQTTNNN